MGKGCHYWGSLKIPLTVAAKERKLDEICLLPIQLQVRELIDSVRFSLHLFRPVGIVVAQVLNRTDCYQLEYDLYSTFP